MLNVMYQALGIQTKDGGKLATLVPIFFLTGLAYYAGIISSQSMFISNIGAKYLPLMYLVEAGILPLQLWIISCLGQKMPQGSLIKVLYLVILSGMSFLVLFTFVMLGFNFQWNGFYPLLFIMASILLRILVPLMWMLGNGICLLQQAKRLFPILGAFFALGSGCAGVLTKIITVFFKGTATEMTLFCVPVILIFSLFLWRRIIVNYFLTKDLQVEHKHGVPIKAVIKNIWVTPLLRITLLGFIILMSLYFITDYQLFTIASQKYTDNDGLTRFFGIFVILLQGVSLIVGLFLNRLIERIGIGKTVTLMGLIAVIILFGAGSMAGCPSPLAIFVAADIFIDVLAFTLLPMINEVLFKLLPNEQRAGASLLFAGTIGAVGKLLSSAITGLHSSGILSPIGLSILGFVMAMGYFLITLKQKRLYFTTLFGGIQNHVVSVDQLESFSPGRILGKRDVSPIREALESADPAKELIALEFGAYLKNEALFPAIKLFLSHPDPQKRLLALQALPQHLDGYKNYCLQALRDPEHEIRAEAVRRIKIVLGGERLREALDHQLNDPSPLVLAETIIAFFLYGEPDAGLKQRIHTLIDVMLCGDDEHLFQACRVIREIKAVSYGNQIETMALGELSPRVRMEAVKCLGDLGLVAAVPALLHGYTDGDSELKLCIENALLKIDKDAAEKLILGLDRGTIELWYLSVSILASLDPGRKFDKLLTKECDIKLKSLRDVIAIPEVLEREGMSDLASLYRKRVRESCNFTIMACWRVLGSYYDPVMVERLQQMVTSTHSPEKCEQGVEILIELSSRFPFTGEMASVLQGRPVWARDSQGNLDEILRKTKLDFPDRWLDHFSDYAMKLDKERSA